MKITRQEFPYLTELMEKYLYQLAAPTMKEAIRLYEMNGQDRVNAVLEEIDILLSGRFSEAELYDYVDRYSDYDVDDSGIKTLDFIRKVLRNYK